jgi:hypothetical protein
MAESHALPFSREKQAVGRRGSGAHTFSGPWEQTHDERARLEPCRKSGIMTGGHDFSILPAPVVDWFED